MSNIINLEELKLAKKVVTEVPNIVNNIDKCIEILYTGKDFVEISKVLRQLDEAKIMLELTLEAYKVVLKQSGVKGE